MLPRMAERRVQFGFNVPWPTPLEQVEASGSRLRL
jgi:hypothetical protein